MDGSDRGLTEVELRRALQPLVIEMRLLRLAIERAMTPDPEPDAQADCTHPADQRKDFGMTDGKPDWQCTLCGVRSIEA
jgi:hypothetical protein